ncbi:MAG: hypothetical protein SF028_00465 [Candidatus Sumerlaeia bacterium]|nr:hypothetical protein [Candidatus Sumerlaeia bacterium]
MEKRKRGRPRKYPLPAPHAAAESPDTHRSNAPEPKAAPAPLPADIRLLAARVELERAVGNYCEALSAAVTEAVARASTQSEDTHRVLGKLRERLDALRKSGDPLVAIAKLDRVARKSVKKLGK